MMNEEVLTEARDQYAYLFQFRGVTATGKEDLAGTGKMPSVDFDDYFIDSADTVWRLSWSLAWLYGAATALDLNIYEFLEQVEAGLEINAVDTGGWVATTVEQFWKWNHEADCAVDDIQTIVRLAPGEECQLGGGAQPVCRLRRLPPKEET